ncbi:TPA: hypothetical protein ACN63N_001537 [Klebsiella oxytoca]|jgi:hypothetical protein|uniref:hypothetical protein n=2 Tax=Klebsiella oxytoca TaxID=571 RepID=UPI0007CBF72D|nr:hypothetical protein [Klebsiella oxytoca]EJM1006286.1 hypothetical protein [Klebsiella oxytoca]EKQ7241063.1 hypothetical protein [Klebsiella oxytoca]EKT8242537.1 hypothetical protein [Klebsiella oxytoca]EKT9456117.1 hypothetical protein [Klebsiella oxytoca]ELC8314210.1 hypothetical protein [Klebsiella oxytoca]
MTKLNKLTIASLLVFIALNKTASAEQSEFLNAIKNINLQSIGANETVEPSDNRSQNINSEASINDKLEQKNKKLQMKYEKLLGSYNEIKLNGGSGNAESQKTTISVLTNEKDKLNAENTALRKQLADATSTLSAMRKQEELSFASQKKELSSLGQENARLLSESEATRKQLAEAASQLAALRKQNELSAASQKKELSSLGQENARLLNESEATRKQLAEAASQLAALRKQNELSAASQKKELSSLGQENARLLNESEATRKQLAEAANKLASLEKSSQQSAILKTNLLKTPEGKNSYSLGVFYYDKINAEFEKITKNNIKLAPSLMIDGMNDAFNKSLKINKSEIMENVVKIDRIVQSINSDYAKKILKLINKKKYEVLANGSFLVTDKSTSKKYSENEIVTFDMLEKNLNGKPILNTMNTNVNFNQIRDPLLRKVVSEGGKGGAMTLYGKADILYKNVPDGVSPESLVSITFMLK